MTSLAPQYGLSIAGQRLDEEFLRLVERVEYESADGIADVARVRFSNPEGILTDLKLLQPGNEMSVYAGYDALTWEHIGRVRLVRRRPQFERDSMGTMEIVGYTRDHEMMDNSPDKDVTKVRLKRKQREAARRVYKSATLREVLEEKAKIYGFRLDIDDYNFGRGLTQKSGMSDYDFVKGLANLTGYVFWVDGDEDGNWTLHCVDPKRLRQSKKYTFRLNAGDDTTLLEFEPEHVLRDTKTRVKAVVRNEDTGKTFTETFEDDAAKSPDAMFDGDVESPIENGYTTGGAVKLYFGEHSIDVITTKRFKTSADLKRWAEQWFRRNREDFVNSRGILIGVETLMARQRHNIAGASVSLDGEYYFTRVRHTIDKDAGYHSDFNARKLVG